MQTFFTLFQTNGFLVLRTALADRVAVLLVRFIIASCLEWQQQRNPHWVTWGADECRSCVIHCMQLSVKYSQQTVWLGKNWVSFCLRRQKASDLDSISQG